MLLKIWESFNIFWGFRNSISLSAQCGFFSGGQEFVARHAQCERLEYVLSLFVTT